MKEKAPTLSVADIWLCLSVAAISITLNLLIRKTIK
jgi:hypothetical protein